jgi:ribonuclease Z
MKPRGGLLLAIALVLSVAAGVWHFRGAIAERLLVRVFDRALANDPIAALPDGLHVGLCGSGSPMPDPTRSGPCTVVVAGSRVFVVDSGVGSTKTLSLMNLPPARVGAIFLTHFHSDHIADLGELMLQRWAGGAASAPVPVYGPPGVDQVVAGFNQAYLLDRGYRIAHHGPKVVPPSGFGGAPHPFAISAAGPDVTVIDEPDLKVVAFPVNHHPVEPAVGYLFVYKGRRAVVSGDTAASPRLVAAAKGADVLVHEGLSPRLVGLQRDIALRHGRANLAAILHDILSYHTTPEQAAGEAEQAHVRYLLFTHVIPPLPMKSLEGPWLGDARSLFHGTIRVGHDGDFISMPAGSRDIRLTNRLRIAF